MSDSVVLVLSNSADATADYLCQRLTEGNIVHYRFDTDAAIETARLTFTDADLNLAWNGHAIRPNDIQCVIYRRPKPIVPLIAGDAFQRKHAADEWAEAIEGFLAHIPPTKWINYPPRNFIASHKVEQLTSARACGLAVPEWVVTNDPAEAAQFLRKHGHELVAKPLASGYIEREEPSRDTLIYTHSINQSHEPLFDRLPGCPVLFQTKVNKAEDIRMIVLDSHIAAISLKATSPDGSQRLDIRRDNMQDVRYKPVSVPPHIANGVRALMRGYGLRFAAIDFAIDSDGRWIFFEVNPNGQWAWLDLVGACDMGGAFVETLRSKAEADDV